jgi:putative transposase
MPRRARIMLPGVPVHAVQRGNNRAACFYEDEDRSFFLHQLGRLLGEEGCALHAYCLMTNHVHLLLTPQRADSCAVLFKRLGLLHTQYTNRKYGRTGTLWEGRFRSCLVQSRRYLLACQRYVELNPVRAGIASHPGAYPWSSYLANAEGVQDSRITPHLDYLCLGRDDSERRHEYRRLFGSHLDDDLLREIRATTNGGYALGTEAFQRDVAQKLGRRAARGMPGRPSPAIPTGIAKPDLFRS